MENAMQFQFTMMFQASPQPVSVTDVARIAREELRWFFTSAPSEESAEARAQIAAWLAQLPTFHRGAFALYFDPRPAPEAIRKHGPGLQTSFAFVLRLACAASPSRGTVEEVERAMTARLKDEVREHGTGILYELDFRAEQHFDEAFEAYVKVRGREPSMLPEARAA
jgi:hypothetical protein